MDTIIALVNYFSVMFSADPDYMCDWLTHMPAPIASITQGTGYLINAARGV